MFERFTERARQVVVLAQDEARSLAHSYIGTEHLLLGLLREEEGLGARVLATLGITLEDVRLQVLRIVGQGDEVATGQIPFTPRAKKVLELGLREALSLGHNYIGTEHLLLGIARENEGVAARILLDCDADAETIRGAVIGMLSTSGREAAVPPGWTPPSPPLSPELVELFEETRRRKEAAIESQDFPRAAGYRDRERRLATGARMVERVWNERAREPAADVPPMMPSPPLRRVPRPAGRRARGGADAPAPWWQPLVLVAFGAVLALAAVVVGWLVGG